MSEQRFLYLSEEDVIAAGVLDPALCNEVTEEALRLVGQGDFLSGGVSGCEHGISLPFPESSPLPGMPLRGPDRRYMAMIGYLGGRFRVCGTKLYGSNTANSARGLPRSNHMIVLNDPDSGLPLSIMSGTLISDMRTGAVAAVGAKHLAKPGATVCGLVGAGIINRSALLCLAQALPGLERVYLLDKNRAQSDRFVEEMHGHVPLEYVLVDSLDELLPLCEVVHFATSALRPYPMIRPELVRPGALLILSCMVDYPPGMLAECRLVVDLLKMHEVWLQNEPGMGLATYELLRQVERGSLRREDILELGAVVNGGAAVRRDDDRPTLLMANGFSAWDIALAGALHERAAEAGIGAALSLWSERPHWY